MSTLIRREIEDNMILFLGATVAAVVVVILVVSNTLLTKSELVIIGVPAVMYRTFVYLLPFLSLAAAATGAVQMRGDKNERISTFLCTLATSRQRVLTAKMVAGLLWILIVILPVVVADVILLRVLPTVAPIDVGLLARMIVTTFLSCSACYAFGLQMGWNASGIIALLGSIALVPVLVSLTVIKGFGIQAVVILFLFTAASVVRTWQRYTSMPL